MADSEKREFSTVDYVVFSLSLLLCAGMGVVSAIYDSCKKRKAKNSGKGEESGEEGLTGGRSMGVFPVSMSVLASFLAAPFVLGTPAEMYCFGTQYSIAIIGFGLGTPIVAHVFIPLFHRLEIISGYQYLELRFSNTVRLIGSFTFGLMMLLYMAVVVYAPALAFAQVTSLPLAITVVAVGATCTFYTAVGGLKAVIWIDVIQMLIILAGLFAATIKGTMDAGGLAHVWEVSDAGKRLEFFNMDPHPHTRHTFWTQTIGTLFTTLVLIGINQAIIQKYLSVPKLKQAQATPYVAWILLTLYMVLVCFLGLVMYAYYEGCDPLQLGSVGARDQLIPLFVMDVLGSLAGIPGLFTAAVFSATLSTVAAGVNALAAITFIDAVQPIYKRCASKPMSPRTTTIVTKSLAVFYGMATIGLAYVAPLLGDALLQISLSIFGVAGGPLLGMFMCGMFFPFVNTKGAIIGLLVSLAFSFWMAIGAIVTGAATSTAVLLPLTTDNCTATNATSVMMSTMADVATTILDPTTTTVAPIKEMDGGVYDLYKISYMWYTMIAVAADMIVTIIVSLLTGGRKQDPVPRKLLVLPSCIKSHDYEMEDDVAITKEQESKMSPAENGNVNAAYTPDYTNGYSNGTGGPHDMTQL